MTPTPQQPPQDWRERFESLYAQYVEPFYEERVSCEEIMANFIASELEAARKEGLKNGMLKYDEMIEYHKDLREKAVAEARREERQRIVEIMEGMKFPRRCKCKSFPCDLHYSVGDQHTAGRNKVLDDLKAKLTEQSEK